MPSNIVEITEALRLRIAEVTGIAEAKVYSYVPEANSPNMFYFVLDEWETLDPPKGCQLTRWQFIGAFTVEGTNPATVEKNIQSRIVSLLDLMRQDMRLSGSISIGHMVVKRGRPGRVTIGSLKLPGAVVIIEVVEQYDGEYGLSSGTLG